MKKVAERKAKLEDAARRREEDDAAAAAAAGLSAEEIGGVPGSTEEDTGMVEDLSIVEIRKRVCLFLTVKDAIACARVCKDWTDDFTSSVWHTIEEPSCLKLAQSDSSIVSKHGHRIRVVKALTTYTLVNKLQNASVSKLKSLSVIMAASSQYLSHTYDLIQRNIDTLASIDLSLPLPISPDLFFTTDAFAPHTHTGSKLTFLKIRGLRMTRNAFSRLLRICPSLQHLDISDTVLQSIIFTDTCQHPTLSHLTASIEQIFRVDPVLPNTPTLLLHFPNLAILETWQSTTTPGVTIDTISKEVAQRCPNLNTIRAREGGLLLPHILVYGTRNLTEICVLHKQLSSELMMAILTHKDTLKTVMTLPPSDEIFQSVNVAAVDDHLAASGWTAQVILSDCFQLQKFSFPFHEMDMDDVDRIPWVCHDLETLYVRVKGLNSNELVNRALQMWIDGKRTRSSMKDKNMNSKTGSKHDSSRDVPIDVRVARHLLRFEKLKCVWLGTKIRQA
ncbi:MAG: hypothetical protein J3Q66DRAFT_363216 [Benniella sp.]|nr:MAG: hypothetical protein J3Q66DRAFT_363216 [Benniella sp.]